MAKERQQFSGVYRGTIVNNRDPKKQRRLQVEVTTSVGYYTDWVWTMEHANISSEVPEIGRGVWIHFQAADHEYPVWFGAFGKHQGKSKKLYVKALADSVSISTVTAYLKTIQQPDGTTEVDLMATLVAMANSLKDHETRIASLETQITQKANTSHSHPGL